MPELQLHELLRIFPEWEREDIERLADEIRSCGSPHPIWIFRGKLLDDPARIEACKLAGVIHEYREWLPVGSLVLFVVTRNMQARRLKAGQRAAVAAEMIPYREAEYRDEASQIGNEINA